MPVAFASIFGGSLTLLGSTVNLIAVNQATVDKGWPEGEKIGFFQIGFAAFPIAV